MKIRSLSLLAAVICGIGILTACENRAHEGEISGESNSFLQDENETLPQEKSTFLNLGDSYEVSYGLKSGSLVYECINAYLVDTIADLPRADGFADYAYVTCIKNGEEYIYKYPEFINEDGSFFDGVYLVLTELTIKSNDAEQYTSTDQDEEGYSKGLLADPYLFAPSLVLVDISEIHTGSEIMPYYTSKTFDYGSFLNEVNTGNPDMDWCLFQLKPGEEITISLGYLIYKDADAGNDADFNSLCLAFQGSAVNYNTFIRLDLTEESLK